MGFRPPPRCIARALFTIILLGAASPAFSQDKEEAGVADEIGTVSNAGLDPARQDESETSHIIVPIPLGTPQLGFGLAVASVWFYQPDGSVRPWSSGVGGVATSNGSWGLGGVQKMSLDRDRLRFDVVAAYGKVNTRYFSADGSTHDEDRWVEVADKSFQLSGTARIKIATDFFVGGRMRYLSKNTGVRDESDPPPDFDETGFETDLNLVQVGPIVTFDNTRDAFAPREGTILNAQWLFATPGLGSDLKYNKIKAYARHYLPGKGRASAGFQLKGCDSSKGAPFFDVCPVDLRGYSGGRFRDLSSWAIEAEWRQPIAGRFGVVGFVGAGGTGNGFGDALGGEILPAGGFGLRYLLAESYGINLRIDAAVGKDSRALYVSLGEAF